MGQPVRVADPNARVQGHERTKPQYSFLALLPMARAVRPAAFVVNADIQWSWHALEVSDCPPRTA